MISQGIRKVSTSHPVGNISVEHVKAIHFDRSEFVINILSALGASVCLPLLSFSVSMFFGSAPGLSIFVCVPLLLFYSNPFKTSLNIRLPKGQQCT